MTVKFINPEEEKPATEPLKELSVDQALSMAMQLHQKGVIDKAAAIYERILTVIPGNARVRHYCGLAKYQLGERIEGLAMVRESVELFPNEADWNSNLGNLYFEEKRYEDSRLSHERALALNPKHINAMSNLGIAYQALGMPDKAREILLRAIDLHPGNTAAHQNLGYHYQRVGKFEDAIQCFMKVVTLMPDARRRSLELLARAYTLSGNKDMAIKIYREWLDADPDNPVAAHMLAAATGEDTPPRAADAYVERTFDGFADSFDAKLEMLEYKAPQFVADALANASGAPSAQLDIVDAGCGTGLCGPLVKPYARSLIGVDLSIGMMEKAKPRRVYDALEHGELTAFLAARNGDCDAVISADTLVYFGALEDFAEAAAGALRPNGVLIFSFEALLDDGAAPYIIQSHGRYAHRRNYVEKALSEAGFKVESVTDVVLRKEVFKPVRGVVVTARKPASLH